MSGLLDFIDTLPAYDTCEGSIKRIDLMRDIQIAWESYYYKGYPVPSVDPSQQDNGNRMDPLQTYDFTLTIPMGSYLTAISQYSEQPEGFALQLKEVSSESNLFLNLAPRNSLYGNFTVSDPASDALEVTIPVGPTIIGYNAIILQQEKLNVSLKNLSTNANLIQVFLEFAIPISKSTMSREIVHG